MKDENLKIGPNLKDGHKKSLTTFWQRKMLYSIICFQNCSSDWDFFEMTRTIYPISEGSFFPAVSKI